jgi:hypothetical protein
MKNVLLCIAAALCLALGCAAPAEAAVYQLCNNVTATQTGAAIYVQPYYDAGQGTVQTQAFQIQVTCAGTCSATAQVVASNDLIDWLNGTGPASTVIAVNYGNTFTATGTNSGTAGALGSMPFALFGMYVTAVSGTNAKVNCTMSA